MGLYIRYLVERTMMLFLVVIAALSINFVIPRLSPGDPIEVVLARMRDRGEMVGGREIVMEYKRMFGLDQDIATQFFSYIREVLKGNLGYSISYFPAKVTDIIMPALPWTIFLLGFSVMTSWLLGTTIGGIVGWRGQDSKIGRILTPITLILNTIPYYMLALILVFLLAYTLQIFPLSGGYSIGATPTLSLDFILDVLRHSILPMLSIVLAGMGWWFLSMRAMVTTVKGADFILMAEAKGLTKYRIMWKHAFRNALIPQVTGLAMSLGHIVGGAILTETMFSYPGIGFNLYGAISSADYPVIQGITLIIVLSVCFATYILDIIYPLVDPRIKHGGT